MSSFTSITLFYAFLLCIAGLFTCYCYISVRKLRCQNEILKDTVEQYKKCADDQFAIYHVRKTFEGRTAVCRTSYAGGGFHFTLIKLYTDDDEEYNQRQAEELCEILNSD